MTEKNRLRGKKSKASGAAFEVRVRADLEEEWICAKWTNNVEFEKEYPLKVGSMKMLEREMDGKKHLGKLVKAKAKWAGPNRPMMMGAGFPDFIAFKFYRGCNGIKTYEIIGVEVKTNGYLDKVEKQKCKWYLDNNVFSKILIAKKTKVKNRVVIIYNEFKSKEN